MAVSREPGLLLAEKTAFITGASSGLGARMARVLAQAGARVIISARRRERLVELATEIEGEGGKAHPVALDDRPRIVERLGEVTIHGLDLPNRRQVPFR